MVKCHYFNFKKHRRTLMAKCDFNKVVLLPKISYIFPEHHFLRTPLEGCFCNLKAPLTVLKYLQLKFCWRKPFKVEILTFNFDCSVLSKNFREERQKKFENYFFKLYFSEAVAQRGTEKKLFFKYLAKFADKHLCQSFFLIK